MESAAVSAYGVQDRIDSLLRSAGIEPDEASRSEARKAIGSCEAATGPSAVV